MKKKTLKLFLILGVIILSLFCFIGCETEYENLIEDEELIEFIISSHPHYAKSSVIQVSQKLTSPEPDIKFIDMYRSASYNSELKIKEYSVLNEYKTIACYAPKKVLKKIFETDMNDFVKENCNTFLFQDIVGYMERNELSYRDLELSFCYVDVNDLEITNRNDVLVYLGELISAESCDGDVTVCAPLQFYVNEENFLVIETDNTRYFGEKFLRISEDEDRFLSIQDISAQRAYGVEKLNGAEVIKIVVPPSDAYQEQNRDFFDLILPAFISSEELFTSYGEMYGYSYAYSYEMIKELLNIQ